MTDEVRPKPRFAILHEAGHFEGAFVNRSGEMEETGMVETWPTEAEAQKALDARAMTSGPFSAMRFAGARVVQLRTYEVRRPLEARR